MKEKLFKIIGLNLFFIKHLNVQLVLAFNNIEADSYFVNIDYLIEILSSNIMYLTYIVCNCSMNYKRFLNLTFFSVNNINNVVSLQQ